MATGSSQDDQYASFQSRSFRQLLSDIIAGLAQAQETTDSVDNILLTSSNVKNILLGLHAIFPNDLLPALDILDRRLIYQYYVKQDPRQHETTLRSRDRNHGRRLGDPDSAGISSANTNVETDQASQVLQADASSANQHKAEAPELAEDYPQQAIGVARSPRFVNDAIRSRNMVYYVRSGREQAASKAKWRDAEDELAAHHEVRIRAWNCSCPTFTFAALSTVDQSEEPIESVLGGSSLGGDLPICKHMLACVLLEYCPQFRHLCRHIEESVEHIIGWASGYGD